ncbi:toxin-antitoxin system YwqK family antitoxin [Algoriphagus litoralis]|uniref:toxin-antitoxin system YwqK family antitoxin n=1 Tax=Algoriphagus litoralis TaxID=2202829 RepID=UPI0013009759|nr:toxin-antitoxin system YwqK family antitoxin [Algoriphagus litoralis]
MKTFLVLLFGLFLIQDLPASETQEYFYFGNTNLVGIGPIEEGKKSGTWKIYKRVNELNAPQVSLDAVRGVEIAEEFDLSVPVFQITFKDNLPDGLMEEFYPNGQIKKLVNFSNGKLNGEFFEFSEGGEVLLSGQYLDDFKEGDWNSYYRDGSKKSEYFYLKNLLQGTTKNYFPNGNVAETIPFEEGKLQGTYQSFFPNGTLQKSVEFANDRENGAYERFYEDGQPEIIGTFVKGELSGNWENYDNLGTLISKGAYLAGVRVGDWKEQIREVQGFYREGEYKDGNKEGIWKVVDEQGVVFQDEQFVENRLVAISEFRTVDGRVLDAGKLVNGTGKRLVYDREGNLLENGRYAKGVRTGVWLTYYPKSTAVASSGSYNAGEKTGTWRYFGLNGESLGEEMFDQNSPSVSREIDPIQKHHLARRDFNRNLAAEPTSSNDMPFLERFQMRTFQNLETRY